MSDEKPVFMSVFFLAMLKRNQQAIKIKSVSNLENLISFKWSQCIRFSPFDLPSCKKLNPYYFVPLFYSVDRLSCSLLYLSTTFRSCHLSFMLNCSFLCICFGFVVWSFGRVLHSPFSCIL